MASKGSGVRTPSDPPKFLSCSSAIKIVDVLRRTVCNEIFWMSKIEMSLDLVAMIRDRLNIAGINNGGFNKELDIITQYLVEKRNWFIEQEKKKSSIAPRKLLNISKQDI